MGKKDMDVAPFHAPPWSVEYCMSSELMAAA
jgi:hypothetical protein